MKNRYDIITEVKKFNPYHGTDGRFTSKGGGATMVADGKGGGADKKKEIQKLEDKADALERELMEELSTSGPGNHSKGWREARTKKIRELRDEVRELKYGRKTRS